MHAAFGLADLSRLDQSASGITLLSVPTKADVCDDDEVSLAPGAAVLDPPSKSLVAPAANNAADDAEGHGQAEGEGKEHAGDGGSGGGGGGSSVLHGSQLEVGAELSAELPGQSSPVRTLASLWHTRRTLINEFFATNTANDPHPHTDAYTNLHVSRPATRMHSLALHM